jgi:gliding motility-associated-like protein
VNKRFKFFFLLVFSFILNGEVQSKKMPTNADTLDRKIYQNTINSQLNGDEFLFKPNAGMWQSEILYRTFQNNQNVSFLNDRISFGRRTTANEAAAAFDPDKTVLSHYSFWEIEFLRSNQTAEIIPSGQRDRNISYFGPKQEEAIKIIEYENITYKNIYNGINLKFYNSSNKQLKYDFIVAPHANFADIQLKYNGIVKITKNKAGQLLVHTKAGIFKEDHPVAWQIIDNQKIEIAVEYEIIDETLSYKVGEYNHNYELVIDPVYLDWSSYFYGEGKSAFSFAWTWVLDIDIDFNNHVYVTGMTTDNFPYFPDAYDTSLAGGYDAFICKMSQKGDSMLFFSYIGGASYEYSLNITVNQNEEPVISGITYSKDYPVTSGAFDVTTRNCGSATCLTGFVTKFNSTGTKLIYSTFLGGDQVGSGWNIDWIRGMTMNAAGEVFVVGNTSASDFPVTSGAYQTSFKGGTSASWYLQGDAFLTKIKADGSGLVFSTFIGGTSGDVAYDVILSSKEEVYVVGYTASGNFPTTPGAKLFNTYVNGPSDAFFIKFKPDGSNVLYAKMMGGSGDDVFEGLYINDRDELYVGGYSNSSDFYVSSNAYQKSNAGGYDFVIVKILSSGTNVLYSTYLGGSANEYIYNYPYFSTIKIAANVREEAIICGITASTNFPITSDALQSSNKTVSWGFGGTLCIAKLSMYGDKLLYGSYYGGSRIEYPGGIRVKRTGCVTNIVFGGLTQSVDYPTSKGAFRDSAKLYSNGFTYSGFVSKFRDTLKTDPIQLSLQDTIIECDKVIEIVDVFNQGADIKWSHGPTTRSLIIEKPGTYWVQATYGCDTVRDTLHIMLEYSPTVPILPSDSLYCDVFNPLQLDARNDTIKRTYYWNTKENTQVISAKDTGLYIVEISTPNCGVKSDSIYLKLLKIPKVVLPQDSVFCDSVNLTLNAVFPNQECNYRWNTNDSTPIIQVNKTGLYSVAVSNKCGLAKDSILITKLLTPSTQLPIDTAYCNTFSVTLKTGRPNNEELYNWSELINSISIGSDDSVVISSRGLYKVEINNRCGTAFDTINIDNWDTPILDFQDTIFVCDFASIPLVIGKTNNDEKYKWSTTSVLNNETINSSGMYWAKITNLCGSIIDSGLVVLKQKPLAQLPKDTIFCLNVNYLINADINDNEARYYWNGSLGSKSKIITQSGKTHLRIENRCGISEDSFNIIVYSLPVVELGDEIVYCGAIQPTDFSVGTSNNGEQYLWHNNLTTSQIQVVSAGLTKVSITNQCGTAEDSVNIRISPYPKIDLGTDTILCGNFNLLLDAGGEGNQYLWSPKNETTRTIVANKQVKYKVVVTNTDGCSNSDEYSIGNDCISSHFFPSAFTPNKDGLNEIFKPNLINFENYSCIIFNRWGQKIFSSDNPNIGWDGYYQDKLCEQGQYFYIINLITTENMEPRQFKGAVMLLR